MGVKDSKPSCISYEDAVKRVTDSELRRIKEAFKKSAGVGGNTISKTSFLQDVLSEGVPSVLADWLYMACGGTQRGIAFKELLCGLVLLTKGIQDEKIRFLWNVYCNESGTHILKFEFTKLLQIEATYQTTFDPSVTHRSLSHTSILISLFGQSDRVTFEQFKSWITIHKTATVLSKWLLLESAVNLTTELETPTFFQSLAGVTHLEEQDIGDLEKVFWLLKGSARTGQLDVESLSPLISPPVPRAALAGVFLAFDENRDGHIDFKELCCGVSAACRGPTVERTKFCFKIFDIDRDGVLNFTEINQMIDILLLVSKECSKSEHYKNVTAEEILCELNNRAHGYKTAMEKPSSFSISQEDFMMWCVQGTSNLVQPFLDLLFEMCHIVLGLRPQCKHLEHEIVKGWLSRETKRGYRVGQFWYLISSDWWSNWAQYTQSVSSTTPCMSCKVITNYNNQKNVDEAMICDESFTSNSTESMGDLLGAADSSSLGSGSSGISCGRNNGPPGPIDNSNLVASNMYKHIQTLTGEGGRLKRDLILSQHKDYELVPDSLWKALSQWYKGPLPLPRQVIQPISSANVELELYPLNLKILRHQNQPPVAQPVSSWGPVASGYGAITASNCTSASVCVTTTVLQSPPKKYLAYTAAFSRLATIKQVTEFLCQRLKLKYEDVRLWNIYSQGEIPCLLEDEQLTLQELMIADNDQFLLEIRNRDLTWPEELCSLSLSSGQSNSSGQDRRATLASIQSVHAPGATGLHNLGNTCFMNAALQVLFNTQPLTQYFKQNKHLYELNATNKLGTKGQLALRYADLLKEVWTASTRSVAPLKLRFCMTKHAPQFAGGGQHDSQELLEWLLDGLHEDLNRVTDKPYSELKDSDGRADCVVAAEAWLQHQTRNQSIIIDLFYGQLKSKVSCMGCGRESVRFDPFSLLSLPLPMENFTYCEALVILLDGSVPIKYGLRLNSDAKYLDFKKELSTLCSLNASLMLVCELSNSQIRCQLSDECKIKPSTATELYVYEMPKIDAHQRHGTNPDLNINIENGLKDIQRNPEHHQQLTTRSNTSTITTLTASSLSDDLIGVTASGVASFPNLGSNNSGNASNDDSTTGSTSTSSSSRTSKVSRCFGNTVCMPQTLLCFKQTGELSCSPESTFTPRRTSAAVTLLNLKDTSSVETIDEATTRTNTTIVDDVPHQYSTKRKNCKIENDKIAGNNNEIDNLNKLTMEQSSEINGDNEELLSTETDSCNCNSGGHDGRFYYRKFKSECSKCSNNNSNNNNSSRKCDSSIDNRLITRGQRSDDALSLSNKNRRNSGINGGYLIAVHRKLSRQDTYFLSYHKTRPSLFGVPLIIPCHADGTNKDLYCAVWIQVARLLSPLPPTPPDQANHATDCDDSLGYEFPFILRAVTESGRICAICPWSKFCRGCEIPCNDDPLLKGTISSGNTSTPKLSARDSITNQQNSEIHLISDRPNTSAINIAIDWDPTALHLRYQSTRERVWIEHETVSICRRQQTEPVDLDHCLRAFTSEEKLEQWYHCAHCKGKKPATKKLQIWKLPPILIIHLKRFNYVNNKWVKSQKVVNFPFDNFDPTPYLASVPQETILRHKELLDHHTNITPLSNKSATGNSSDCHKTNCEDLAKNMCNVDCDEEIGEFDREMCINSITENETGEDALEMNISISASSLSSSVNSSCRLDSQRIPMNMRKQLLSATKSSSMKSIGSFVTSASKRQSSKIPGQRKRLVSTSLTKTPVIDGEFIDFHKHKLEDNEDPYDLKYQLYAVVSHSGMLNGGHYISYASNPNKSWYCYNDSSCREISTQPNIDPGTAYLLFYERKGLDYEPYLPNFGDKPIPNGQLFDVDDSDSDLRKMCVLS